jgi:SAM-dependent methyltransferase
LVLARLCPDCSIIATDVHQPFLDELTIRANKSGLTKNIKIRRVSMDDLPYEENSVDIIWSEGSAFIMGLIPALTYWKKFLKPDGYLVVSDCTWFTDAPSEECRNFWNEVGPDMKNEKDTAALIQAIGYSVISSFRLPASGWWDHYYTPLSNRMDLLRKKYANNDEAGIILMQLKNEMEIHRKYSDEYGYTFFILQSKR